MSDEPILCGICKETKPTTSFWRDSGRTRGFRNRCKDCEYKLINRRSAAARQRRYELRNKDKQAARILVRTLIKKGVIMKQNCFLCDESDTEGHHIDYNFPDKVVWLCIKHHTGVHHG